MREYYKGLVRAVSLPSLHYGLLSLEFWLYILSPRRDMSQRIITRVVYSRWCFFKNIFLAPFDPVFQ